jgi:hypothetical protein
LASAFTSPNGELLSSHQQAGGYSAVIFINLICDMKKNASKKHHYLPRHYLMGFTNIDNYFFIYDKRRDNIFISHPDDAFFENNLNMVELPDGNSSDFIEGLYTNLENRCWPSIDRIRKSNHTNPISLLDKMHLFLFLLFLYCRLPSNAQFVEKLSEKAFLDNNEFDYFKLVNKSGEDAPKEAADMIKKSPVFKKSFRQVIPFIPFFKDKDWANKVDKWRFIYTGDDKSWNMVGDKPIIVKGDNAHNFVNGLKEFVFPVSGNITLVNTNNPLNKGLPPEFTVQFNTAIIENSERFVACNDKHFLEAIIDYHKLHRQYKKTDIIIPELFEMLEQ